MKPIKKCPVKTCKSELPIQYIDEYKNHPPLFVPVFGWSQVGKTVFLYALTLMLKEMSNIWPNYYPVPTNDVTQEKIKTINSFLENGIMPSMTKLGEQDVYIMLLNNMERWGGRSLVLRDCAGETFDTMKIDINNAPFLLHAPTTFMFVDYSDMTALNGSTVDMLMNNYVNTFMRHDKKLKKQNKSVVVVITKGDIISDLPSQLRRYLIEDPIWAAVTKEGPTNQMYANEVDNYLKKMSLISNQIKEWIGRDAPGKAFLRNAEDKRIDLRFSIISSTGTPVNDNEPITIAPKRVLDPFFWALELQS
jgi:hypothetical protein